VDGDQLVGGSVCRFARPLRYLQVLPEGAELLVPLDLDRCFEVTHAWFPRTANGGWRSVFYVLALWDGIRQGRFRFLGGTANPRIKARHMLGCPTLLYSGPASDAGGHYDEAWLYTGTVWTALTRLVWHASIGTLRRRPGVVDPYGHGGQGSPPGRPDRLANRRRDQ
jgi:hypothetical protein